MNNATPSAPRSGDAAAQNVQDNKGRPPAEQMKFALARIENSRSALILCQYFPIQVPTTAPATRTFFTPLIRLRPQAVDRWC